MSYQYLNVLDRGKIDQIIVNNKIDTVVHLSALLSAVGERNPELALQVNMTGFQNVLDAAKDYKLRLFCPSTIGAFGPETSKTAADLDVMRPTTIYGITKVHMELMGSYYHKRYGVDFRSVRLPGVISFETEPGGGTTDYAVDIFHHVIQKKVYKCFLTPNTRLPMIYILDCLEGIKQLLEAPTESLSMRVYNMGSMDFTPSELFNAISKKTPVKFEYFPDFRQEIADSWPHKLDDKNARKDWGWNPKIDIDKLVELMFNGLGFKTE